MIHTCIWKVIAGYTLDLVWSCLFKWAILEDASVLTISIIHAIGKHCFNAAEVSPTGQCVA